MDDLRTTYLSLSTAVRSHEGLSSLSKRQIRRSPWVIFDGFEGAPALASDPGFVDLFVTELVARKAHRAITELLTCFLFFYPERLSTFDRLRHLLAVRLLPLGGSPRMEHWRDCVHSCRLLEADAPETVARRIAESAGLPNDTLASCGLKGMLCEGNLVREAFGQWLAQAGQGMCSGTLSPADLKRILDYALVGDGDQFRLRFGSLRVELADRLLRPFAEGHPTQAHRALVKEFVLRHYGDPRIVGGRGWQGVCDQARGVVLRWLVTTTLEDFFRLLEHAAETDATARRHWRYRKAFWDAYLRAGHMRDAWVALGPKARDAAGRFLSEESKAYGRIEGAGVQQNHSVLLLRIGDLTISEWSHSGKVRIWNGNSRHAPTFYDGQYTRSDVTTEPKAEGSHHGSERGTWQANFAGYILQETGIPMSAREYMPK